MTYILFVIQRLFTINIFQEFKYAIERLRAAYYPNTTTLDEIRRANIDLISDSWNNDGILKATVLHARANTAHPDRKQHKNTFLFR